MRIKPSLLSGLAGIVGLALVATPVSARQATPGQDPAPVQPGTTVPGTPMTPPPRIIAMDATSVPELVIEGKVIMRLRSHAGGLTPEERAYDLRQRLGPILTLPGLNAADVVVRQRRPGQTASIYIRQRLLITVDRNLARANNSSIEDLALQWATNLRRALPKVNVTVRMSSGFAPAAPPPTTGGQ